MPKREKQRVQGQEGATQLDDISAFVAELFKWGPLHVPRRGAPVSSSGGQDAAQASA